MRWFFYTAAAALLAVAGFATWSAFNNPDFVLRIAVAAASGAGSLLLLLFKPRNLTDIEKQAIREGWPKKKGGGR